VCRLLISPKFFGNNRPNFMKLGMKVLPLSVFIVGYILFKSLLTIGTQGGHVTF
jgi:hypothetical protein